MDGAASPEPKSVRLGPLFGRQERSATGARATVWRFSYAPNQRIPLHRHEAAYVCCLIAGDLTENSRAGALRLHAGEVAFYPRGEVHDGVIGASGARLLCFELHDAQLWSDASERPRLPTAATKVDDAGAQLSAARLFAAGDAFDVDALVCETAGAIAALPTAGGRWIGRVRERLSDETRTAPTIADLAALSDTHPTHLMRAFRAKTGTTIGEYLRRRRVAKACRLLAATARPLSEIAADCGFADQSHFTRVFRALTGRTPTAFRNLV